MYSELILNELIAEMLLKRVDKSGLFFIQVHNKENK